MRKSRVLKIISYIAIPILVATLVLSILSIVIEEDVYYDEEKYFQSEDFVSSYMNYISNGIYNLIHNNNVYHTIQDGDIEIRYTMASENSNIKNQYYLILYKNLAITNVNLTDRTNSLEEIQSYISQNKNSKKVNIINGEIDSQSEIIQSVGIKYLDVLSRQYYTIELDEETTATYRNNVIANAEDFQIYSSFVEEFSENSSAKITTKLLNNLSIFKNNCYVLIPTSAALLILILVYLVNAIGYKKGEDGISLNDFDKIPLEIIIIIIFTIACLPFVPLETINNDYNAIISLLITGCLLIYISIAIIITTIIKRIKSKTLLKTTITGKIIIWIANCLEKLLKKWKSAWGVLTYSSNATTKVIIYAILVGAVAIFILLAFRDSFMTVLLEFALVGYVMYKIIKTVKNYSQIEAKLKEMYEGNNQNKLLELEFIPEFRNSVKYINDISNGFENAIQDRMKSERLKAELITNVSHDIKTPLTSIINYVDLLKQENIENEKAKEYINILDNKSQRLKKLTEDLIEASKVSTGNITLNLEKINIVELIKQALGEFEDKFEKRGLKVIIDSPENEINIMADSRYMYRIIENLFSNIVKYALDNSRVYVDIKTAELEPVQNYKNVIIEIKNISKDRLNISAEELIQRFVRGDKSRTTEGSGLGISIAQNLTELQQGEFNLKLDGDLFKVELKFKIG